MIVASNWMDGWRAENNEPHLRGSVSQARESSRPMRRRTPGRHFLVLVIGSLLIHGFREGGSRAEEAQCVSPPYISALAEVHYHPSVMIVLYERNPDPSSPIHDVVALITPGKGLGIETTPEIGGQIAARMRYRAIHAHDDSGDLHVEHDSARGRRMCEFLQLWREQTQHRETIEGLVATQTAHVRIGDAYRKDVPLNEVLQIPLIHDMPIILFIEKKTRL